MKLHHDRVTIVQPEHDNYGSRVNRNNQGPSGAADEDNKGFRRFLLPPAQSRFEKRRLRRRQQQPASTNEGIKTPSSSSENLVAMERIDVIPDMLSSATDAETKTLSSSSESSSESEEEAFVDGFRSDPWINYFLDDCFWILIFFYLFVYFSDSKETFVLEIDDETDEDLMSVLLEQELPEVKLGIYFLSKFLYH